MSASYPLPKLWSKIISQKEDFEFSAEELLKDISKAYVLLDPFFKI